jgi:hypothetical protein
MMIHVYINYPNPHFTIHSDSQCPRIQQGRKPRQRYLKINRENFERIFVRLRNKDFRFAATPEFNDMWLSIDMGGSDKETPLVTEIKRVLARHYRPFANAPISEHC